MTVLEVCVSSIASFKFAVTFSKEFPLAKPREGNGLDASFTHSDPFVFQIPRSFLPRDSRKNFCRKKNMLAIYEFVMCGNSTRSFAFSRLRPKVRKNIELFFRRGSADWSDSINNNNTSARDDNL